MNSSRASIKNQQNRGTQATSFSLALFLSRLYQLQPPSMKNTSQQKTQQNIAIELQALRRQTSTI
ncbi:MULTISPECIES: hypothetical protein [unclassified Delftia]|uniref:hypothetical protein n=1 Tax=unclassified Delftia TaxID=2613839 RepID=UPI0012DFEB9D|nr:MULTISPECIES: hypothetical protein [unclassified Delftia]MDC2861779.1 hypothetical protein [Delftia sp. DT-2]